MAQADSVPTAIQATLTDASPQQSTTKPRRVRIKSGDRRYYIGSSTTSERVPPMLSNTSNRLGITAEELMAVTVTSKGQVTVPKQVRDRLGIKPGSKVDFEIAEDGRAFLRRVGKRTVKPSRFERMRGTATSGLATDAIMALSRGESR